MLSHSSMAFVFIQARIFLKESIVLLNIINMTLVLGGLVLIVHPPFIFGYVGEDDFWNKPSTIYAYVAAIIAASLLKPSVSVCLRKLRGKCML